MSKPAGSFRLRSVIRVWVAASALAACSTSGGGNGPPDAAQTDVGHSGGTTGNNGSGGSTSSGGAVGSGGITGSGGISSTGGAGQATGSGGLSATGGVVGSGGSVATGGVVGSGGASGAGSGGHAAGGVTGASGGAVGTAGTIGGGGAAGGSPGHGGAGGGASASGGAGGAPATCPPATKLTGGKQYCANSKGSSNGGYSYELWSDGTGMGCMTVYGTGAAFSATWTNAGDFLARIGLGFDQTKTPTQIGTLSSDFAETKTGDGLVYVGIYGWTVSPLREYYIIDDWGSTKPAGTASDGTPRTHVGVITVDGDTYDVWKRTKMNAPAITGDNQTFDQYFSVRQNARQCGHISISEHFSQWTSLGLQLGKLEEAKLLLEAQDSTGTIDFTTATVVVK
jgi:endo-1,4-beta-xylanase